MYETETTYIYVVVSDPGDEQPGHSIIREKSQYINYEIG